MLSFNPYYRPSARNLLKNELFNEVRVPKAEELCQYKIKIDIDIEEP